MNTDTLAAVIAEIHETFAKDPHNHYLKKLPSWANSLAALQSEAVACSAIPKHDWRDVSAPEPAHDGLVSGWRQCLTCGLKVHYTANASRAERCPNQADTRPASTIPAEVRDALKEMDALRAVGKPFVPHSAYDVIRAYLRGQEK